jgi:hypothetical protein
MDLFRWILFFVIIYGALNALRYSRGSKKATDAKDRGIQTARMNMYLGTMLVSMALIQILYYEGSTVRIVIGSIFLLLGLFNVLAGYRNFTKWNQSTGQ